MFGHRILWPWGEAFVVSQGFLGEFDGLFELRVMAADDEIRPLRNNVVGIHAVVFHDPFAAVVRRPECKFRRGDVAAVVQGNRTRDADEPAPSARANNGADFLSMEEPGKASPPEPASSLTIMTFGP